MQGTLGHESLRMGTSALLSVRCELCVSIIGIPAHQWVTGILVWISKWRGAADKGLTADKQRLRRLKGHGARTQFRSPPPGGKNRSLRVTLQPHANQYLHPP